jgi:hypothetical protein
MRILNWLDPVCSLPLRVKCSDACEHPPCVFLDGMVFGQGFTYVNLRVFLGFAAFC